MSDEWAVRLLQALNSKQKDDYKIMIAEVVSITPLTISVNDQLIKKFIYTNSTLIMKEKDDILSDFQDNPIDSKWFEFLKQFHELHILKPKDLVVTVMIDKAFYILNKVV